MNPLFLQSALCALSHKQLLRIIDTPDFDAWSETAKALILGEIDARSKNVKGLLPPANPVAA